jgi:hypothetical protein
MIYGTPKIVTDGLQLYLDAANPTYAPSRNLLRFTTDLTNAAWNKFNCQITASAAIAPDGTNTAFAFNSTISGSTLVRFGGSSQMLSSSIYGGPHTFSVFVKQKNSSASLLQTGIYDIGTLIQGTEPGYAIQNNFIPSGSFFYGPGRTENYNNGWYRIITTATLTSSINIYQVFLDLSADTYGGTNNPGEGIYIWGPQFEAGTVATQYQPIVANNKTWPSIINSTLSASLVNNVTYTPNNGGSMLFNGINQYSVLSSNINFNTSESFTVSAYVNINKFDSSLLSGAGGNSMFIFNDANTITMWTEAGGINIVSIPYNMSLNTNTYITVTRDTNNVLSAYKNGILISNSAERNGQFRWVIIGSLGGGAARFFGGNLYNLKIYNRALSQQEITQNYNATKSRFNLS